MLHIFKLKKIQLQWKLNQIYLLSKSIRNSETTLTYGGHNLMDFILFLKKNKALTPLFLGGEMEEGA